MTKFTFDRISTLINAPEVINGILTQIETALDTLVSRDGASPNQITANVDFNSKRILNLPSPASAAEPVTLAYFQASIQSADAQEAANEAAASAALALTYKDAALTAQTNAETAETNAETAQGLAEDAQAAAEAAQAAAEDAQAAAEAAQVISEAAAAASNVHVNVLHNSYGYELTGDGTTNDGPNLNSLIGAVPSGAALFFPPAPGGFYSIATQIVWPNSKVVSLIGTSDGSETDVTDSTCELRWTGGASAMIDKDDTFTRGGRISNIVLNGNTLATSNINFDQCAMFTFENLVLKNAVGVANMILGDGVANVQENRLCNIKITNRVDDTDDLPNYNLVLRGINNNAVNLKLQNASAANLLEDTGSADNAWVNVHCYNYLDHDTESPFRLPPTYNFETYATGSTYTNWEADGSSTFNVRIGGYQVGFMNGISQFDSITAETGVKVDNSRTGNRIISNTFRDSVPSEAIVFGAGGNNLQYANWIDEDDDFDFP